MGAVAAGLCHSHSNARSELHLHHSSWQCRIPNSLSKDRDRTCVLMDVSQIYFYWAMAETPHSSIFWKMHGMAFELEHNDVLFTDLTSPFLKVCYLVNYLCSSISWKNFLRIINLVVNQLLASLLAFQNSSWNFELNDENMLYYKVALMMQLWEIGRKKELTSQH